MNAPPKAKRLYFVNAPVDFLFIGGLSLLTFALFYVLSKRVQHPITWTIAAQLSWVVNWPHFSATNYRLYHSRENVRQYPMTALAVPWLIVLGIAGSFASPAVIAPYFVKLFLIWSPYHFSGQSVGITLVYARRAGVPITKLQRLALSGFIFGTFLTSTIRAEVGTRGSQYYGIEYPGMGLPVITVKIAQVAMLAAGALFLILTIRWCVKNRRLVPLIVFLPAIAQYVWFIEGGRLPRFNEYVPFFHSLQYLLIAWSMQLKEKLDQKQLVPSHRYVLGESARWGVLNFLGGVALFWGFPQLVSLTGLPLATATGVVIAGVQVHHFFVDGVIWKLKSKAVSSPLMGNLSDLVRRPAPPPAAQEAAA